MSAITTRGVFMDSNQLREMSAAQVVWMAVHLSGKKRRAVEEELELVPGQIDRWSSRKDHHSPSLEILPELIEATTTGRDAAANILVQWLLALVEDRNLKYDPKAVGADELQTQIVHLGAEFGQVATCVLDAVEDNKLTRAEALRCKNAAADVIARAQTIVHGVEPYI